MKILTIVYNLHRGGTERAAQNFSIAYKKAGHDVSLLPIYEKGVREEALKENDIEVWEPYKSDGFNITSIKNFAPEIIHIHRAGIDDDIINEILSLLKKTIPSVKVAETNVFSQVDFGEGEKLIDLHMHLSKWCFWKWKTDTPFLGEMSPSTVLPYMVLPDKFKKLDDITIINQFKKDNNIPEGKFIYGRVAQKSDAKWSLVDIRSFLELSRKYNDIHLVLLGLSKEAEEFIESLNQEEKERITILDYIDGDHKLNILYNCYDTFIHAARIGESFGMVFAESMLAETPVITMATPLKDNSQHEVIAEGAGFVVRDMNAMMEKMEELYQDREKAKAMGKEARDHILNNYTPAILTEKAITLFNLLINNSNQKNMKSLLRDNGFVSDVTKEDIVTLYSKSTGEMSSKEKLYFLSPKMFIKLRSLYTVISGNIR